MAGVGNGERGPPRPRIAVGRFEAALGVVTGVLAVLGGFLCLSMAVDLMDLAVPEAVRTVNLGFAIGGAIIAAGVGLVLFGCGSLTGRRVLARLGLAVFALPIAVALVAAFWYLLTAPATSEPTPWGAIVAGTLFLLLAGAVGYLFTWAMHRPRRPRPKRT